MTPTDADDRIDAVLGGPVPSERGIRSETGWSSWNPVLPFLFAGACALRLYLALTTTYCWDEEREWIPLAETISFDPASPELPIRGDRHPALAGYFIRAGAELLGPGPAGFRLFSLLASALTLAVAIRFAQAWAGWGAAVWTAVLLGFNEYHIGVSALAFEMPFFLLFTLLAVRSFARGLESDGPPRNLCWAAFFAGLAFLCNEIASLLVPVFFLSLVAVRRPWLRRCEPYVAVLVWLLVISPDLYANFRNPAGGSTTTYAAHLERAGGLGLSYDPFVFYGREAVRHVLQAVGRPFWDYAPEYPSMNPLWGMLLLGGVFASTARRAWRRDAVSGLLLVMFWLIFGFFVLLESRDPGSGLDPAVWFWVSPTLLAAALLTARRFVDGGRVWRVVAMVAAPAAVALAILGVAEHRLWMSSMSLAVAPEFISPADGRMAEVEARLMVCAACPHPERLTLVSIRAAGQRDERDGLSEGDVDSADFGADDRLFRVRALPGRAYDVAYRVANSTGQEHSLVARVYIVQTEAGRSPRFWAR